MIHGSLFSGLDAPSVAAYWMGWENAFHCEINDFCNTILKYWFPNSEHYEDITKTDFSQWRGKIDILTGGFPCQPFSVAGQRKGADDNRYLWPHMLRAIREIEYCYNKNTSLKPSVKTLNEKDIPSNRCLFRLVPSERPTEETGCGLLPTVQTQGLKMCDGNGKTQFYPMELLPTPNAREADKYTKKYNPKSQMGTALTAMAMNGMLPTPTSRSYKNGSKPEDGRTKRKMKQGWTMELNDLAACGMLPTPTTNDYKGVSTLEALEKRKRNPATNSLADRFSQTGKTSQLNPLFVEEMMGFPLMWTTLPFLSRNGDKNQSKDMEMP